MSVIGSLQNLANLVRAPRPSATVSGLKPYTTVDIEARVTALRARAQLLRLYSALESLADTSGVKTSFVSGASSAQSSASVALDLTHTAATLSSSGEINNAPMSFSPFGPDWDGASSAELTISGEYDGSHGTGPLSFEVRRAGTHGVNNLRIRVDDPNGGLIGNFNLRTNDPLDQAYDLQNGLFFTLGSGDLIDNDTTTIQVRDNLGAAVDPNKPLGGIRNDNPNLQFGGPAVVDGQFSVNGESISVATTDTLNDVISRINQSAAGVTAVFNAASERIDFAHNTLGSAGTVDLQGDTSNFLAATRLDSINVVGGIDPEDQKALDQVAAFSSVQSGSIFINDVEISIDTAVDSLNAVIDRINASEAGVTASFDSASQRFLLETNAESGRLAVDGNDTGLFTALNLLANNDYSAALGSGFSKQRSYRIADAFSDVFGNLNSIFKDSASAFAPLASVLRGALGGSLQAEMFGLRFDDSAGTVARGDFALINRRELTANLQQRGNAVASFLGNRDDQAGLVTGLLQATRQALTSANSTLNLPNSLIDIYA